MTFNDIFGFYMHGQCTREEVLALYDKYSKSSSDNDSSELIRIAVRYADHEALSVLLNNGLRPSNADLVTLATRNVQSNHQNGDYVYRTAILLLDAKVDPYRKDEEENTCFHLAARYGDSDFIRAMHDKKVRLTSSDAKNRTCLHLVCEYCYNSINDQKRFKELAEKARNSNNPQLAAQHEKSIQNLQVKLNDYYNTAKILLEARVDPDQLDDMLEKAVTVAIRKGAKKIAALLSGDINEDDPNQDAKIEAGGMSLHEAVLNNDVDALRAIIKLGTDVNELSDEEKFRGMTPLGIACGFMRYDAVSVLLENGADPNYKDVSGRVPLAHMISYRVRNMHKLSDDTPRNIINIMKEKGFDLNASMDEAGNTLLTTVCGSQDMDIIFNRDSLKMIIIEEAVRAGVDVNITNNMGQTPLMIISTMNYGQSEDIQRLLIANGADPAKKDNNGNTALIYACGNTNQRKAKELAESLLDTKNALLEAVNNEQKTALDYATEQNNEPLVKLLLNEIR